MRQTLQQSSRPAAILIAAMAGVMWLSGCMATAHAPASPASPSSPATSPAATPVPPPAAPPTAAPPAAAAAVVPAKPANTAAAAPSQAKVKSKQPASDATAHTKAAPLAAAAPASAPAASPPAPAATLDLATLKQRLRDTSAIGVFTKLALKNQVDDLLDKFRAFYSGQVKVTLPQLRQSYDLLVLKVLALLQDSDPPLAKEITASREAIWGLLADPQKFATL